MTSIPGTVRARLCAIGASESHSCVPFMRAFLNRSSSCGPPLKPAVMSPAVMSPPVHSETACNVYNAARAIVRPAKSGVRESVPSRCM